MVLIFSSVHIRFGIKPVGLEQGLFLRVEHNFSFFFITLEPRVE